MNESNVCEHKNKSEEKIFCTADGTKLFIYETEPVGHYNSTVFIISGITGINHRNEKDIIDILSNDENRVVVLHPRGTGCSEGKRGDISSFSIFLNDYIEVIQSDKDYRSPYHCLLLYGHSMSTAILLGVAAQIDNVNGVILINPPYIQKKAKGMSPSLRQYLKFMLYMLFAKHKPVVNMAGNPSKIDNKEDRKEAEQRIKDSLLVQHFSMYYMNSVRKLIRAMPDYCIKANYPLLLIHGLSDAIVDKRGCDIIFSNWKHPDKKYLLVRDGTHGKSTVRKAAKEIQDWIKQMQKVR